MLEENYFSSFHVYWHCWELRGVIILCQEMIIAIIACAPDVATCYYDIYFMLGIIQEITLNIKLTFN